MLISSIQLTMLFYGDFVHCNIATIRLLHATRILHWTVMRQCANGRSQQRVKTAQVVCGGGSSNDGVVLSKQRGM